MSMVQKLLWAWAPPLLRSLSIDWGSCPTCSPSQGKTNVRSHCDTGWRDMTVSVCWPRRLHEDRHSGAQKLLKTHQLSCWKLRISSECVQLPHRCTSSIPSAYFPASSLSAWRQSELPSVHGSLQGVFLVQDLASADVRVAAPFLPQLLSLPLLISSIVHCSVPF